MAKLALNHVLEIMKALENLRLKTQQIDPGELAKIIDKTDIIRMPTHRSWCRSPYISKHKLKRFRGNTIGLWIR